MPENRFYATGKRKTSIARVWLEEGEGEFIVNHKTIEEYFDRETHRILAKQPFELTNAHNKYRVYVNVCGGGNSGQAGAIKHGISKALLEANPDYRDILKRAGFLTRDSRITERKKYGQKKARKGFQWTKR